MFMIMLLLLVLSLFILYTLIQRGYRRETVIAIIRAYRSNSSRRCRVHYSDVFRLSSTVIAESGEKFSSCMVRLAGGPRRFPRDRIGYADRLFTVSSSTADKPFVTPPSARAHVFKRSGNRDSDCVHDNSRDDVTQYVRRIDRSYRFPGHRTEYAVIVTRRARSTATFWTRRAGYYIFETDA